MKILSIQVTTEDDNDPDLSHIGYYSNERSEHSIELKPSLASMRYRFFHPALTPEETGNPDSPQQDLERMESFGETWNMLGIVAEARVQFTPHGPIQTICSSGLWGVESDSGEYIKEVSVEQLEELKEQLGAAGFGPGEIAHAIREGVKS